MTGIFLRTLHSDPHPVGGDLKRTRAEDLGFLAADEGEAMGGMIKRKRHEEELSAMLGFLRSVAAGDRDAVEEGREWVVRLLVARRAMFLKAAEVSDSDEFPFPKKQKIHKFLELSEGLGSRSIMNQPTRRSTRTVLRLGDSEMTRKRVPVDPSFQADVPDWTSPPNMEVGLDDDSLNDSRRMGIKLWPIEGDNRQIDEGMIGKGRSSSCFCLSPGSTDCIRFHVKMSRIKLICELGPAFASLGFDDMGEEVSKLWSQEEQMKFDDLVRENPVSEGKSFLEPALEYFTSKSRQEIISFYYNVFFVRWMSLRTRTGSETVSSDDENMESEGASNDENMGSE
ncbi:AT-rich interactive domain-containing protein 2-like [Iris pallida]|uniref:AT-rich interactive domain-containing protein 2-like n=1 Tax=Iris pallida TaxID=29817 RepID=A0AAX6ICB6_IRIPA|nr:AT-rich interactive domain-containing protein 2-like [Iris pallida]KAJ6850879.1 AT-rich interactive domain-containing protein 2-like [Iris pallida]